MKRLVTGALALAFCALLAPSTASAQISIRVGGAATFPIGDALDDYGSYAKTGWMASAGVLVPVGEAGLGLGAHGFYGSNSHESPPADEKTNLYGVLGSAGYTISTGGSISPTIFGLVGFMTHSYKPATGSGDSASALAWGGGASVGFPLGGIGGAIDAFYLAGTGDDLSGTKFFGVGASVSIPLGGDAM
jgi:hypothetical protein